MTLDTAAAAAGGSFRLFQHRPPHPLRQLLLLRAHQSLQDFRRHSAIEHLHCQGTLSSFKIASDRNIYQIKVNAIRWHVTAEITGNTWGGTKAMTSDACMS